MNDRAKLFPTSHLTINQILSLQTTISPDTPRWSPDGTSIMVVSSIGKSADLWSIDKTSGFPQRITLDMGNVSFLASRMPLWSPDGRYISYVSRKTGSDEVWIWPIDGTAEFQLTNLGGQINSMNWFPDSNDIVIANNRLGQYDIYRVAVSSGKSERLTSDPRYEVNPAVTPDGQHILYVRLSINWEDHEIIKTNIDGSGSFVIATDANFFDYSYGGIFGYPIISPDGNAVLFRSQRNGFINIWKTSIQGGEPVVIAREAADQSGPAWSPDSNQIAYISNHNGTLSVKLIGIEDEAPQDLFSPPIGASLSPQWSPDGQTISFLHGTPTTPDDLWEVSIKNREAKQITYSAPRGNLNNRLAKPQKITYESFDGLKINAYLYAPNDRTNGTKYPGVLFIHGGPTSQFIDNLQIQVQYLVQRGYVVLLPNIRGSSGYGTRFEELNDGNWGDSDLQDVLSGAKLLKRLSYVDESNIGITGTSYGGVMTMCAIAFAPGAFQAGVAMSGYADWPALRQELEIRHIKLLEHEFGPYEENKASWHKSSAIYRVDNVTTPCFVLHGEGQEPRSEASQAFVQAMNQHYKTVQYKTYPNEGYYVRSTENLKTMLPDVADFFDMYLKTT